MTCQLQIDVADQFETCRMWLLVVLSVTCSKWLAAGWWLKTKSDEMTVSL